MRVVGNTLKSAHAELDLLRVGITTFKSFENTFIHLDFAFELMIVDSGTVDLHDVQNLSERQIGMLLG